MQGLGECYHSVDVEILASWCKNILESLLVLRCSCPRWMRGWRGDHHEEWLKVRFVVQEVQGDISLTHNKGLSSPILPDNWELNRQTPSGEEKVILAADLSTWSYFMVTCKHAVQIMHLFFRQSKSRNAYHYKKETASLITSHDLEIAISSIWKEIIIWPF